jgi:predicted ATPase/DNA-binding winged helix-turn-helix (wHTH) protein
VPSDSSVEFPPFRLDLPNQQLWCGGELVPLRPKPFAVLAYLATHAGRLVPRAELAKAVWPDTYVGEDVLRGYIRDVRTVLGDDPEAARFIETVARRGYRFIAPIASAATASDVRAPAAPRPRPPAPELVGREAALGQLHAWLAEALEGTPQVVFLAGEPGVGKTTVVDAFLAQAESRAGLLTVRGQCVEHFGAGEAYLPMLEALGHLGRQPGGERLIALLRRYAPSWLVQMPALIADDELEAVQRRVEGTTRERMLRELGEAIEVVTAARPLILVLEDLQWSDFSTLDLVAMVARRRGPAQLLLLGTYRPAEVIASGHPLRAITQELRAHGHGHELELGLLSAAEVAQYLATRFPHSELPFDLAHAIHRRTEGNPLFIVNVLNNWVAEGVLGKANGGWKLAARVEDLAVAVPESLRLMIEKQLERLEPDERRMLEAASAVGVEFSTAAVAAALTEQEERVEEGCEKLAARGQWLSARGMETLATGPTGRYGFVHALYQEVLYERVAAARRVRLHFRLAEWGESAHGARARERAAELATHFERGQDPARAVQYLSQAAENAMRRQAPHEAVVLLKRSLELLETLPETRERTSFELALLVMLGVPLLMTRGYAAPDVERTYARARVLCQQMGESPQLLPALAGLFRFYFVRAELETARELADQVLRLAEQTGDRVTLLTAHSLLGALLLCRGEFLGAREHLDRGIALYDPHEHRFMATLYGDDPGVTCHCFAAMAKWYLGHPDQALAHVEKAVAVAEELGNPYSQTFALDFVTWIRVMRREEDAGQASVEALIPLATEHGFPFLLADCRVLHGWILAEQGRQADAGAEVRAGIAAYEATGARMSRPSHLMLLAKVHGKGGEVDEALRALTAARAVSEETGERSNEAEFHRLRGELTLLKSQASGIEAEACFRQAIAVARRQHTKALELRAATSLARLWERQGKRKEARAMLAEVYGGFTEGLDTRDLLEAGALLGRARNR